MQFTCSTQKLVDAIQTVSKAMATRSTNPALEGILFETDADELSLTCTDERITIATRISAEVSEPGRGIVPGKLFGEVVRKLTGENVNVTMDNRFKFRIRSSYTRMTLAGNDPDAFPSLPVISNAEELILPQKILRDMIEKTEFAISADSTREILTGALLDADHGTVTMVALDGFRMAMIQRQVEDQTGKASLIIPGRGLSEIGKLLSETEDAPDARVIFGQNKLHLTLMDTDIFVSLIAGEYINYNTIIPKQFSTYVDVNLAKFRSCIDRAALIARDSNSNVVSLRVEGGELYVEAHSQIGEVHEELEVNQEGEDRSISFNVRYLTELVRYMESDSIRLCLNSAVKPCVVRPSDNPEYMHLILPVRTGVN